MTLYQKILKSQRPLFAVLIDPQNSNDDFINTIIQNQNSIDLFLVGGSLVWNDINKIVQKLKKTNIPVLLFPGNCMQISPYADAILFLSLISGRNPEYLIGQHVQSAMLIKQTKLEVIPTGYILIENSKTSATQYITNTNPIPDDKTDLIIATAVAGELLGMKAIYLEGGSGSNKTINPHIIASLKKHIEIPIFVGGGIKSPEDFINIYKQKPSVIVVGNAIEKKPELINKIAKSIKKYENRKHRD